MERDCEVNTCDLDTSTAFSQERLTSFPVAPAEGPLPKEDVIASRHKQEDHTSSDTGKLRHCPQLFLIYLLIQSFTRYLLSTLYRL